MDSFSSIKTDESSTLNSKKLLSPIESCYRSPLRDTTNCVLPIEVGGSKKSDPVGPHQLPGEKREFTEENDISHCQQSTPVKHLDCDTESDTTAEYESAGEASPWEKPSNVSALADYLAGVHLSTPDKIYTELTSFPFSPISAEDECDDEVTAIISNASQSSSHTLSFHEREETYVSKQDRTVSHVANTSFSDVDPDEFKISVPCKRHSETNISSFNSEDVQISEEALNKEEINSETEISCSSQDGKKLKVPNNSLNESVEITSSVVATVEQLCDSVNQNITCSSHSVSPKIHDSLNLSSSYNIIQSNVTNSVLDDKRKSVERSPSSSRSTSHVSSESPVTVISEKDVISLTDSLDGNVTLVSEMESSSNVLQTSHINDYVTTTKQKIDTIFSSKKEIVSNVICETKHQIDNMFKRKSPIKELASNTVSHVIDSIKNLNVTESDISPQKNVVIEKISSPISSAKQKIDSLFSPKKKVLDKEIFEKSSVLEVSVVKEELLKKEINETNRNNSSFNTVTVENLDLVNTSASGLSVIPLTTVTEKQEAIETTKQQIDQIFKSLSPQKCTVPNEVLELSNSTMSTDLEQDDEVCITSSSSYESGFQQYNQRQCFGMEFAVDKSPNSSTEVIVSDDEKIKIDEIASSSKVESTSYSVLHEADKSVKLEHLNETSTMSEVPISFNLKLEFKDDDNGEILNKTTADEVSDKTQQKKITEVQGDNEKTVYDADRQLIENSISGNDLKVSEQNSTNYPATFEVFSKGMSGMNRTFHVISPKKESFNISLSAILDQKEDVILSENITEPLTNIQRNDLNFTSMSENKLNCSTNSKEETGVDLEHSESISVSQSIADIHISPLKLGERIDSQVFSEIVCSSEVIHQEVKDIAALHRTIVEEVIDKDLTDNNSLDSLSNPLEETLDTTAVVDQMALRKEEVEDFVVVDVSELDNRVSAAHISPRLSSSGIQEKEVSDISHALNSFCIEQKESEDNISINVIASTSEVILEEMPENKIQMSSVSPGKELMKCIDKVTENEVQIIDVDKRNIDENPEKNDVKLDTNISKNSLVVDEVDSQENVISSSLVVSSVEVKEDVLNIVSDVNQSEVYSQEICPPLNVESVNQVESTVNITENLFKHDSDVKNETMDVSEPVEEKVTFTENDTEINENISVSKENDDFNHKAIDDSTIIKNDSEQLQFDPVDSSLNVEFVNKVEATTSVQDILADDLVTDKKVIDAVPAEEKLTGVVKDTAVDKNISVPNEINDFIKKTDRSFTFINNDNEPIQSNPVSSSLNIEFVNKVEPTANVAEGNAVTDLVVENEVVGGVSVSIEQEVIDVCVKEAEVDENISVLNESNDLPNIALEKNSVDSEINTLKKNEDKSLNLSVVQKSPVKQECIGKTDDFITKEILSESRQSQTYVGESKYQISSSKLEEEKITVSKILCEEQKPQSPVKTHEIEPVMVKQAQYSEKECKDRSTNSIAKTNVLSNESIVHYNEAQKPSINDIGKSTVAVKNDLFGEIFQREKDQLFGVNNKNVEGEQNLDGAVSKSFGIPSIDDSNIFKNAGFSSSEDILYDNIKSPPFACPVSSESISFGSPTGQSLSLPPIDTFTGTAKYEPSTISPIGTSVGDSISTVSCTNVYSSSAEIEMGLKSKSSSESLEIVQSAVSKQNNELSTSSQATLQIQGDMSTRNEKYYTYNKNSKEFRGSPASKNSDEVKNSGLIDNFKAFKLDDLSKSTIERKSYEDLLDRCLEQERLLGFDETIKEEADKLIKELANASSDDIVAQPDEFPPANANNSEAGPVTADEDLNKADLFQDATLFDFDYLAKCGGKGKLNRRLIRDSLFLNFDPLAATLTPEPAEEMAQADSSSDVVTTPLRPPLINGEEKLVDITPSDEAACSPASSTVATPPRSKARPTSCSATPTLRHEILSKEISKLQDLMMRQESSYQEQIAACAEEVEQLREKLAELEARDHQEGLQGKLAATEAEAAKLRKEVAEAAEAKKQLMVIMEEYEKTISQVVTMREDDKKKFLADKEQLKLERDDAFHHLRNMEIAFNDVHQKYEKCKEVIEAFKHNEEQYKFSLNENRKTILQQEENYQKLKEHAAQKLEQANIEITEMKKAHQAELAKMVALQRKMEIKVKSLEESLEQKKREAAELTKICDDLITKVEQ